MDQKDLQAIQQIIKEELQKELEPIKADMGSIKKELEPIKADIGSIKKELGPIKEDINILKTGQKESYDILKALIHNQELASANIQLIKSDVNYMKGDIEKTKKNMSAVEKVTAKNWSDILEIKDSK